MDIQTVRQKYPQYGDLSDEQLAKALHGKFYSDMPYDEFSAKIGMKPAKTETRSTVDMVVNMLATPLRELPGIKRGVEDIVDAGAQMLVNALPEQLVGAANMALGSRVAPTAAQFNQQQAQEERDYQARRIPANTDVDVGRLAGNMAGIAPLAALMPGPGASLLSTGLRSAATGGVTGSMQPVTDDSRGFWDQKQEQAGLGALTGGIAGPALQAASRVVSPRVDAAVKYLRDRGVTPRPGQLIGSRMAGLEDKAMSVPFLGGAIASSQRRAVESFNRAAYNEVLKPLGTKYTGPVGREGIASIQKTLSDAYDDVLLSPKTQFRADKQFVNEFKKIAGMAKEMPPDKYAQFQAVMENRLVPKIKGGGMDGTSFKALESELNNFARKYAGSASPDDRNMAEAVREVLKSARGALERSSPGVGSQLRKINQAYSTFTRVQDAASRVGTEEGIFTPNHLLSAVRNMDKSARKGAFARGDAVLQKLAENGKKVIGIKYPDSGTAGRLANMAAGGALVFDPVTTLGVGAVGSLPYSQAGQSAITSALTQRSPWARPVGNALNRIAVPGGGVFGPLGVGLFAAPPEKR